MTFQEYEQLFRQQAVISGLHNCQIEKCLNYAHAIMDKSCPVIYSGEHLAMLVGYKYEYLCKAMFGTNKHYRTFRIPKRNGGYRKISEPLPSLKEIQYWILYNILYKVKVHPHSKAYIPKRSIKDNLKFHRKQKTVLTMDIQDFFSSIKIDMVTNVFLNLGYSRKVSKIISHLLCLNDRLPQGAPTSPYLTNIIMYSFDERISKFCKSFKEQGKDIIRYTRYADDMTFSGDFDPDVVKQEVKKALGTLSLELNETKTKIMTSNMRQTVTGCVVNEKMQLPKSDRQFIRQQMYYINKFGVEAHLQRKNIKNKNYLKHLLGQVSYECFLNPQDTEFIEYKRKLKDYINVIKLNHV